MASQPDCDLNIHFVITRKHSSAEDCSTDMWHAFNSCDEHELSPKWISEKECDKLQPGKTDVFVMDEFEGPTFEKLKTFKCVRIVGPRCLLNCFMTGEPIPEGNSPVFTTAMRGLVLSASGFSAETKAMMQQKVEFMGGIFAKQLRSCTTHLIVDSVSSVKYERAIHFNLPVVTAKWLDAVWEASLVENVKATSSRFDEYKCPIFLNLYVTSTNLSKRQREEVKRLITENGGHFMGALDGSLVKIVITTENTVPSAKLTYAMQNNIACVKLDWMHESIRRGYALPTSDYLVTTKKASTPEKLNANTSLNFSTVSTITGDPNPNGFVEESMMRTMMSMAHDHSIVPQKAAPASHDQVLAKLNTQEAKNAGPFLDGCNIYVSGFSPEHRDKINRILNFGSATRLDDISDAITHVIIGDQVKASADINQMKNMGVSPYFLSIKWLEESMNIRSPAAEENFLYELRGSNNHRQTMEPPSPLSKKNLQLLQKPKRPAVPVFDIDAKPPPPEPIEEPDLVQEYLRSNVSGGLQDTTLKVFLEQNDTTHSSKKNSVANSDTLSRTNKNSEQEHSIESDTARKTIGNDSTIPSTQTGETTNAIFKGLTFILTGFNDSETYESLEENTKLHGGLIVPNSFKGIPDFGVVPLLGAPLKHTVNEIVTDMFIEDCLEQEQLIDVVYYHRPVSIDTELKPLKNCVIAVSSYTGKERTFLSMVVEALGGRYQDTMARRADVVKNTLVCTHLVCPIPEGSKYNAAVKWKLPAVNADWVMACVNQQAKVNETPYLIGETMAPEHERNSDIQPSSQSNGSGLRMCPPSTSNVRQIITPKRHLSTATASSSPAIITPINKRLNLSGCKTPSTSSVSSTPETPYGQFLKPDPSPDTRKRWVKWIESMPDMRVTEPPLKRRNPSTPLSDLKRHLWKQMKEPIGKNDEPHADDDEAIDDPVALSEMKDQDSKSQSPMGSLIPAGRKMSYSDENSPTQTNQINLQLAQLDQMLRTSNPTPESRHSLSAESMKNSLYNSETTDHIAKCVVKDSQPDTVGWEDPIQTAIRRKSTIAEDEDEGANVSVCKKANEPKQSKKKFMLSGIKDRTSYENAIEALGGIVSTEPGYDPSASHLVCVKPGRNEKLLASIAAGKWVLHCTYLIDSEKRGRFLNEENYEWGNAKSKDVITQTMTETEKQIAASAHRWRTKLSKTPGGAFDDMVALLIGNEEKCRQFRTLICAGGGSVVEARPPYNTSATTKKITHCFIQLKQHDQPVDWAMMASKGILCFLPQYLSDHLTAEQPLNPKECVLPEFRKYLSLLPK